MTAHVRSRWLIQTQIPLIIASAERTSNAPVGQELCVDIALTALKVNDLILGRWVSNFAKAEISQSEASFTPQKPAQLRTPTQESAHDEATDEDCDESYGNITDNDRGGPALVWRKARCGTGECVA
jgi:hypothetical protein